MAAEVTADAVLPRGKMTIVGIPFTPFKAAEVGAAGSMEPNPVDLDAVKGQAAFAREHGFDGPGAVLLLQGTTGEWPSLTVEERLELAAEWRRVIPAGTGPKLMLHVGHTTLSEGRRLCARAAELEYDAVLISAPAVFVAPTVELQAQCVAAVANVAPHIPAFYYHYPSVNNDRHDVRELLSAIHARAPSLVGLKISGAPDVPYLRAVAEHDGGRFSVILTGAGNALPGLEFGARAIVAFTWEGLLFRRMLDLAATEASPASLEAEAAAKDAAGDGTSAGGGGGGAGVGGGASEAVHAVLTQINAARGMLGSLNVKSPDGVGNYQITGAKALANALGLRVGPCRLPLPSASDEAGAELLARAEEHLELTPIAARGERA